MAFNGGSARAGAYAQRRYRRGLRAWRTRTRLIIAVVFGPFIALGLVGLIVAGHWAAWIAGMVFGVGAGAIIAVRESPPGYIENWQVGAEGERKTEKALQALERPPWLVVHDVEHPRGNYDHIVVGPAGVFLLDSKNLLGVVYMRDGQPYLRRRLDPDADARCGWVRSGALSGAAGLYKELRRRGCRPPWVHAVVVLWSDFEEGVHEDGSCVLVHGSRLCQWISERPATLDQATTDELVKGVQAIATQSRSDEPAQGIERIATRSAAAS
jgi:hypothetical protein